MKFVSIVLKLAMVLGTLAVALGALGLGLMFSSPTGFFSASQSAEVRFGGNVLLLVGVVMVLFSFSFFKRNNLIPFLIEIVTVTIGVFFISIPHGPGQDVINVVFPYLGGMLILYFVSHQLDKRIPEQTSPQAKLKNKRINMFLFGIPIVLLVGGWWYINYGFYWREQAGNASTQKTVINDLGYQTFTAKYIPTGYKLRETRLGGLHERYFYAEYRNSEQKYFMLAQFEIPKSLYLEPPVCRIYGSSKDSFEILDISGNSSGINSTCIALTTPKGQQIFLMEYEIAKKGNYAAALIGNTLVTVTGFTFPQAELIKMFDSLEAKTPAIKAPNMKDYE